MTRGAFRHPVRRGSVRPASSPRPDLGLRRYRYSRSARCRPSERARLVVDPEEDGEVTEPEMVSPRIATSLEAATDLEIHEGGTPRGIVPRPGPGDDSLLQTESSFEQQGFPRAQAALRRQDRSVGTGRRVRGRE